MSAITYTQTGQLRIYGRSAPFWVVIAILIIMLFTVVLFFVNNTIIRVTYTFADQVKKDGFSLTYDRDIQPSEKISFVLGDLAFVSRDATTIHAQTVNADTLTAIGDLPFFGIPHFHLTLKPQQKVEKIAGQTLGCTYQTPKGVFSYSCTDLASAVKINQPQNGPWTATPLLETTEIGTFKRYKDGFLSLVFPVPEQSSGSAARIDIIVPGAANNPTNSFTLPKGFTKSDDDNLALFTDNSAQNPGAVIANTTTREFLYIKDVAQPNDIVRWQRKAEKVSSEGVEATFCAFNKTQLACLYDVLEDDHAQQTILDGQTHTNTPATVEIVDFNTPTGSDIFQTNINNVGELFLTPNGSLFAHSPNEEDIYELTPQEGALGTRVISSSVDGVGADASSLYFLDDGKVYEYVPDEATSYLKYKSEHYRLSSITAYGNEVTIEAFVNYKDETEETNDTHTFKLTDTPQKADEMRIEDYLPYESLYELGIEYMDFNEHFIYVALTPAFSTDPNTGARSFDPSITEKQKQTIRQKLQNDKLLQNRQLIFSSPGE